MSKKTTLAEVALEVAHYIPDDHKFQGIMPRAEWRWMIVAKAKKIIKELGIDKDTEDIDELISNYLSLEESLS